MQKICVLSTFILASLGFSQPLLADSASLATFFSSKVKAVELELAKAPAQQEGFVLEDINIELAPDVSFGINSIVSLQIAPELDFVLTPPTP